MRFKNPLRKTQSEKLIEKSTKNEFVSVLRGCKGLVQQNIILINEANVSGE